MKSEETGSIGNLGSLSRRSLLKAAAVGLTCAPALRPQRGQIVAYVGAYTDRGKGIHMFYVNPSDGTLTPWKILTGIPSPSSLAWHPSKKYLYAVNEISNYNGTNTGSVTAMAVDQSTGDLRIINVVSSRGGGPAHLSVDPTGNYVYAANYGGGSVAMIPIGADGSLAEASDVFQLTAGCGTQPAVDAPPGSFAISGHDAPHAHMAETDPNGRFLLLSDLCSDRIYSFQIDKSAGKLSPNSPAWVQAYPGAGPRHFAFHPNGRFLYSLNEEASTLDFMSYNPDTGAMAILQTTSTLPDTYEGTNYPSEIHVSGDGRFVYCANRLHDSIAIFSIASPDGWVTKVDTVWTRGSYPRHFDAEPTGNFVYILHSRSDNLSCFRLDRNTGGLAFAGKFTGVGNPSKIVFLQL